jgi:hypothetical protein
MLVRYFRAGFPAQYVTAGILGAILWSLAIVHPPPMPDPCGMIPFYSLLYKWLSGIPVLATLLGLLLVISEACYLNILLNRHELIPKNSTLTALLFLICISYLPAWLTLTPVNLFLVFLLVILKVILKAYAQPEPVEAVFSAGFLTGIASLFYFPGLFFLGFLLVCFLVYRLFRWRIWISSLIGLLTPFLFLVVTGFLTDKLSEWIPGYIAQFEHPRLVVPTYGRTGWILSGILGLSVLFGLGSVMSRLGIVTVELRKKNLILLWLLSWVVLTFPFSQALADYHLGMMSSGLAPMMAGFFLKLRKPFWHQFLLWLTLLAVYANTVCHYYLM